MSLNFTDIIYLGKAVPGSGGGGGSSLPDQTGHSGEFLTTDGTDASWAAISGGLPSQTGNSGKFLTTDGTDASWAAISGGLPSQTGNSGKFLTTDGTDASWSDKPLVNTATQNGSLVVGSGSQSLIIDTTAYGVNTIGFGRYAAAFGKAAVAKYKATAIGANTTANEYTIQIGQGGTNSDAGTMKVALTTSSDVTTNYELLSADGTIPHARLINAVQSTTVTIATTDWSSNTASVTVSGLTATSVVWVAPDNASQSAYTTAGVYASSQSADTLAFSCTQTPASSLTINVVWC